MSLCGYHSICDFSHCCNLRGRRKKGREGEGEGREGGRGKARKRGKGRERLL